MTKQTSDSVETIVHNFDTVNKDFLQQLESLREVLPLLMIFINVNNTKATTDFVDFVNKKGTEIKDENGEARYTFSPEDSHNVNSLEKNAGVASAAVKIVPSSLFVSLVSQFDCFLGRLIREIFRVKPDVLNSSEKNIPLSKLLELKNVDDAKEYIIEKEVESILRESHSDHFNWLETKLGIPLRKDLPSWQNFIEITERRNLFVHCDGVISNQYLSICKKHKVDLPDTTKIGVNLDVSQEYFEKSFRCLYEIATKLTQVVWRKLVPSDLENADESLIDVCFELIKYGQFDIAISLLDFATRILPKHYNEESKNVFIINQALALKLSGKHDEAKKLILAKDWSANSDKFKIAKETLLDNFDESVKLMKKIGDNGEIKKLSYKTWPLFIEFRKTKIFTDVYKEIFKEDYILVETPKKLFDQLMGQIADSNKQNQILSITSFLDINKPLFPNYQFIHYRAEEFIKLLQKIDINLSPDKFKKILQDNITTVKKYNDYIIKISPTQYLNPYTMIRHCLYINDKIKYKDMLFEIQITNFEMWLNDNKK
ncbi:MAG: hypothetical protein IT236_08670 [Bacteroidia bacterium]|nr:hypothetical protein [Bacteroidia bacterium]